MGIHRLADFHRLNDDELNIPRRRNKLRTQRTAEDRRGDPQINGFAQIKRRRGMLRSGQGRRRIHHPDGLRDKRLTQITRVK